MTLVEVINDWRNIIFNLGLPGEFRSSEFPLYIRRKPLTTHIEFRCSLERRNQQEEYFTAQPEEIPNPKLHQAIEELKRKWQSYSIQENDAGWGVIGIRIALLGPHEEMKPEVMAIRAKYGEPLVEYY